MDHIFIKNWNKSGVNGKWVRDDALAIIREKHLDHIVTEEHAHETTRIFQEVLGRERVSRGPEEF